MMHISMLKSLNYGRLNSHDHVHVHVLVSIHCGHCNIRHVRDLVDHDSQLLAADVAMAELKISLPPTMILFNDFE